MLVTPATTASKALRSLRPCVTQGLEHVAQTVVTDVLCVNRVNVTGSMQRAAVTRTDSEACNRHKPRLKANFMQYGREIANEQ